jgi:hypothetical protein
VILGIAGTLPVTRRFPAGKKYIVRLLDEAPGDRQEIIKDLKGSSQNLRHVQILLKPNADGPGW